MEDLKSWDQQDFPLEPPKKDWPRARGRETIVVAEDSEPLRDLMLALLSGLGYEVITAAGGHEALRLIEKQHGVDLIVTDTIMPKGGGFQIVDEVHAHWPATPIILTSGFSEEIEAGLKDRVVGRLGGKEGAEDDSADPASERANEAAAGEADDEPATAASIVEFLPKPFSPEQLARLVRDILDRAKAGVPPRKNS